MNKQKGISSLSGIVMIVSAVVIVGGIITWQLWSEQEISSPPPVVSPTPTSTPSPTPSPDPEPSPTPEPYIKVISPNGGEEWEVGKTYQIKWNCPDDAEADVIDIFIKDKRENIEKPIGSLIKCSLGKYSWKVGSVSSGQDSFQVQLRHVAGAQPIIDESDNYFSIVAKDETADWKTYTNEEYGYEIKYPKEVNKESYDPFELALSDITQWDSSLKIEKLTGFYKKAVQGCFYMPLGQTVRKETLTANNTSFCLNIEQDSGTGGGALMNYYYLTEKDGEHILLDFEIEYNRYCGIYPEYTCEPFDEENDTKVFGQIFSTFKFID